MTALAGLMLAMLRMNLRNRIALVYGFAFPLLFLIGFWALYRNDPVPLALHAGQFLTITILGAACFGLPTQMVAEREAGIWRRFRLTPAPTATFITATLLVRLALLMAAVLLQLGLAQALGMPAPFDPAGLMLALLVTALAFLGLGAVIAMIVPNVPAVQALGQCLFLPMLIIGGVAVPLTSLPDWALTLSVFLPGRHAVSALQASVTGLGTASVRFELVALIAVGAAAFTAATMLFRWQPTSQRRERGSTLWLVAALAVWGAVGGVAIATGRTAPANRDIVSVGPLSNYLAPPIAAELSPPPTAPAHAQTALPPAPKPHAIAPPQRPDWQTVVPTDFDAIAFAALPPDNGLVSPIGHPDDAVDPVIAERLALLSVQLPSWPPGKVADPVQRVRNLLTVAAVPDLLQIDSFERQVPLLVLERLQSEFAADDLNRLLYWVAMHPDDGDTSAIGELERLRLPATQGTPRPVRERIMIYAMKLLGRQIGATPPAGPVRRDDQRG
jgi:ABC-2 type transport system permease protein